MKVRKHIRRFEGDGGRRGSATLISVIALTTVAGLAGVVLAVGYRSSGEIAAEVDGSRAFYAAEAGIYAAMTQIQGGNAADLGSPDNRVAFSGGSYWVDVDQDPVTGLYTLSSVGRAGLRSEGLEVVMQESTSGIYRNAIFAGNSSGDRKYKLGLSGSNASADEIFGDVYSGGDIQVTAHAQIFGKGRATGKVLGHAAGEDGIKLPTPDIAGMNYEHTADIDVGKLFAAEEFYTSDDAGGKAWQVPEANPAHIFRKNPSDRSTEVNSTQKDDYFIEDPYEPVRRDVAQDGSDPYPITISGFDGEPGTNSNQKVFFIDGNLWVHNIPTYSIAFEHDNPNGMQITFVVKGNIYYGDNVFYDNPDKDGIAFIAIKDENVADSGNIYFGDPRAGTLNIMHGYMFAEENFYDNNLNKSGSKVVEVYGNMTAGNQVLIQRDYRHKGKDIHSKLLVDFDERVADGDLDLPGLPRGSGEGGSSFSVLSWRPTSIQ